MKNSVSNYQVENPNQRRLIVNAWPHHDCPGGKDEHTHYVGPNERTFCVTRTLYSWFGDFDGDDCYGHESDTDCTKLGSFTFNNSYNPEVKLEIPPYWNGWVVPGGCCGYIN